MKTDSLKIALIIALFILSPVHPFVSAEDISGTQTGPITYAEREAKQKEMIIFLESEIERLRSIIKRYGFGQASVPTEIKETLVTTTAEIEEKQTVVEPKHVHEECIRINKVMRREVYDNEVIKLQTFLKNEGHFNHPHITNYFGPVTEKAVQDFQTARGIVSGGSPSTTGFGQVGPLTIRKIEEISCQTESFGSGL